ncbi:MAG: hypothetical protein AB1553_11525 [Nitrospirota bacterium]
MKRWGFLLILFAVLSPTTLWAAILGEIRPKSGDALKNTYVWDGKELRPKSGATLSNTWVTADSIPVPVSAIVVLGIIRD